MSEAELIHLVKKALQMVRDFGQDNTNVVIEIRRGEPKSVRFEIDVKPAFDKQH